MGGTLFTLCILPGIILMGVSFVKLVFSAFGSSEAWSALGTAVLALAIGGVLGFVLNLGFEKAAMKIALRRNSNGAMGK